MVVGIIARVAEVALCIVVVGGITRTEVDVLPSLVIVAVDVVLPSPAILDAFSAALFEPMTDLTVTSNKTSVPIPTARYILRFRPAGPPASAARSAAILSSRVGVVYSGTTKSSAANT